MKFFYYYAIKSDGYYISIVPLCLLVTVASADTTFLVMFTTCGELKRHTGLMHIIVRICDICYTHVARICDLNIECC